MARRAWAAYQADGAVNAFIDKATLLAEVFPVIPGSVRIAAMEDAAALASTLRRRLRVDPGGTDDAAETDRDVLEAPKETSAVFQRHDEVSTVSIKTWHTKVTCFIVLCIDKEMTNHLVCSGTVLESMPRNQARCSAREGPTGITPTKGSARKGTDRKR